MRTVRIVLVVAMALVITTAVVAQEKQKKKGGPGKLSPTAQAVMRMERLRSAMEGLDLTAEQEEKLGKIREELGPKIKEVFGKMQEVLTEEQKSAGEEAVHKAKESGKKGRQFFEAVELSLKLTDEQKEKMGKLAPEILALHKEMLKGVMGVLTPEQQEKLKEKMRPQGKKKREKGDKKETK